MVTGAFQVFAMNAAKHPPAASAMTSVSTAKYSQPALLVFSTALSHAGTQPPGAHPWSGGHVATTLSLQSRIVCRSSEQWVGHSVLVVVPPPDPAAPVLVMVAPPVSLVWLVSTITVVHVHAPAAVALTMLATHGKATRPLMTTSFRRRPRREAMLSPLPR